MSPREHKIVVLGAMGAGKSTLVRALAGDRVVDTDVANTDSASDKLSTTVAMDYADIDLPNGDRLRLYGTPGQARLSSSEHRRKPSCWCASRRKSGHRSRRMRA